MCRSSPENRLWLHTNPTRLVEEPPVANLLVEELIQVEAVVFRLF